MAGDVVERRFNGTRPIRFCLVPFRLLAGESEHFRPLLSELFLSDHDLTLSMSMVVLALGGRTLMRCIWGANGCSWTESIAYWGI
jgi:hypothetical protein